ncbi:MAG: Nif3-like dinuclear metal center hexameric protein [Desulfovibrionaceae bacterium]|nr:Nif3-like dinuclear metal center hexameric protein [Desulfovibrionaceae bacterium]
MEIKELIHRIESVAPLEAAAQWDLSGLQVACHRTHIQKMAVCLDPTPQTITKALKTNPDFILAHHPLTLKPSLPRKLDNYHETLRMLLTSDVALYSAHTSLDVNSAGPAGWLATELDLQGVQVLKPNILGAQFGFGLVGDLKTPLDTQTFLSRISKLITVPEATVIGTPPQVINRVAYCTGSGASLLELAAKSQADIFITGDVKYHAALDSQIFVLDVGHHSLEEEMMRRLANLLSKSLNSIDVTFIPSSSPYTMLTSLLPSN